MARVFTVASRTTFWGGVASLLSVDFGFCPGLPLQSIHAHLLGFGFNIIYCRGSQLSASIRVPFYQAAVYRMTKRYPDDDSMGNPPDPPLTIRDDKSEARVKASIGIGESNAAYVERIQAYRDAVRNDPSNNDRAKRILREVDVLMHLPYSPEFTILTAAAVQDGIDERDGRRDFFAEREGLVQDA